MYEGETEPIPRVTDQGRPRHGRDDELDGPVPARRGEDETDSPARARHGQDELAGRHGRGETDGPVHGRDEPAGPAPSRHGRDEIGGLVHGHGHGHTPAPPASRRVRTIIAVLLIPFALAAVVGAVLLYPFGGTPETRASAGTPVHGVITATSTGACNGDVQVGDQGGSQCLLVTVRMTDGEAPNQEIRSIIPLEPSTPRFAVDDEVVLSYGGGNPTDGQSYQLVDFQRDVPLVLLAALFAVVVLILGRWQGLKALGALVISFLVLVFFVLPAIIAGESPLLVAIAGAGVIMFVVLYLTHGLTARTSTAVLGTMASLALIGVLGALWAAFGKLTGLDEDTATLVGLLDRPIDTRGLLLAGVVIGALGVLDDVTVTQTSAVWELRAANPSLTRRELYTAALRIGRDHVASAVNTLVMAYAGAALPLLLYSSISGVGFGNIVTSQSIAQEIVRTLVGSIGIVAAVPLTTALAAAVAAQETPPGVGAVEKDPEPRKRPPARRDDRQPRTRADESRARADDRSDGRRRPAGQTRAADRSPGPNRTADREPSPSQSRTAGRERPAGQERSPSRDRATGRERTASQEQAAEAARPRTGRRRLAD